jgi:hypothetical protein
VKTILQKKFDQSIEFFANRLNEFASDIKGQFVDLIEAIKFDIECDLTRASQEACHENITYDEAVQRKNDCVRNNDLRPYSTIVTEAAAKRANEAVADKRAD